MKKSALLFLFLLSAATMVISQENHGGASVFLTSRNYRLYPGNVNQTEVFIAGHPVSDRTLFASCNTLNFIPFFISEGVYVTTDGGNTWYGSDTCRGNPIDYHGGDVGITIDRNGTFLLTRLGRAPFVGLYSHYSVDNGKTWSSQQVISTDDLERASLCSDACVNSPYVGRSYAGWVTFASPFPVMVATTDDGGRHWSAQKQVNHPPNRCAGGDIATGPDGEVYVCWAGVTSQSPFREIFAGFASSTDGGSTWNVSENAFPMNGISGELAEKSKIRVNSLPSIAVDTTHGQRRGWIYMITCQKNLAPAGSDPDIILYRSTDRGLTWSAGIRVNQDPLNNGKIQYFPAIHVDRKGAVDIIYYDDRTTTSDSSGVFLARSTDGGDTWHEFEISDHHFKPKPVGGLAVGYQGDNIDITSTSEKLWPVWMDNSSGGCYQVWTVPLTYAEVSAVPEPAPGFRISGNVPNPFTDHTTIYFSLSARERVRIDLCDGTGRFLFHAADMTFDAGNHAVDISNARLRSLPAGLYFCRMRVQRGVRMLRVVKVDE